MALPDTPTSLELFSCCNIRGRTSDSTMSATWWCEEIRRVNIFTLGTTSLWLGSNRWCLQSGNSTRLTTEQPLEPRVLVLILVWNGYASDAHTTPHTEKQCARAVITAILWSTPFFNCPSQWLGWQSTVAAPLYVMCKYKVKFRVISRNYLWAMFHNKHLHLYTGSLHLPG